jgi:hypothetical protein
MIAFNAYDIRTFSIRNIHVTVQAIAEILNKNCYEQK